MIIAAMQNIWRSLIRNIWRKKHFILAFLILFLIYGNRFSYSDDEKYIDPNQSHRESWLHGTNGNMLRSATIYMSGARDDEGNNIQMGGAQYSLMLANALGTHQPVSSFTFIADLGKSLGLTKSAFAAGSGYDFLEPTMEFWKALRNLAYLLYVIIFMAVGLMIMFRTKLNPQVTVSVENSLPKIVVSLLMVTFSYAICGLFVDFVYFGNSFITSIFGSPSLYQNPTPPQLIDSGVWQNADNMDIFYLIDPATGLWGSTSIIDRVMSGIGKILSSPATGGAGETVAGVLEVATAFVLLSSTLKIFFALLTRYVTIFVLTIFSPLAFFWGALPGQQDTAPSLLKNLAVSALSFPAIFLFINLSGAIATPGVFNSTALPPFSLPDTRGVLPHYGSLVGLGILMMVPQIPSAIENALAVKPSGLGQAGTQELSGALRKIPIIGSFFG